jgi:hypothetical protein
VHPPGAPFLGSEPGGAIDFVVTPTSYDYGDWTDGGSPAYLSIGYDLDDSCTSRDAGFTCKEPSWATAPHGDGPGGRDNSGNAYIFNAIRFQNMAAPVASNYLSSAADVGPVTAFRVQGYSGASVDSAVTVSYYAVTLHGGAAEEGGVYPKWDGNDAYDVIDQWLQPAEGGLDRSIDRPLYVDEKAYVTSESPSSTTAFLVSRIDELLVGADPPFVLRQGILTAEIARVGQSWVLKNGVFQGRIPIDVMVHNLAHVPVGGQDLCRDSPDYWMHKVTACAWADISYTGPDDSSQPCDAESMAWRFADSAPVVLTGITPPPPGAPDTCSPGQSPLDDHCQ